MTIAVELGLIYAIMALGVYLTFRILDFPDLTVDGSFTTGAAVAAISIVNGINPIVAIGMAFVAGFAAGVVTGLLTTKGNINGLLAGILGKKLFDFAWTKIDDEEPPKSTTEETTWGRLLVVAAVQGVIFRITRFVVDRYGAIGFRYLTGVWPGEKRPDPDD